jgi:hypothetical protein
MTAEAKPHNGRGGRPKGDAATLRIYRVNARLSATELADLNGRAERMGMPAAQYLREAALSRRLPSPPVPAINREQYAELARLSANLNQLVRLANSGQPVTVADGLLERLAVEVKRLRLALIGAGGDE